MSKYQIYDNVVRAAIIQQESPESVRFILSNLPRNLVTEENPTVKSILEKLPREEIINALKTKDFDILRAVFNGKNGIFNYKAARLLFGMLPQEDQVRLVTSEDFQVLRRELRLQRWQNIGMFLDAMPEKDYNPDSDKAMDRDKVIFETAQAATREGKIKPEFLFFLFGKAQRNEFFEKEENIRKLQDGVFKEVFATSGLSPSECCEVIARLHDPEFIKMAADFHLEATKLATESEDPDKEIREHFSSLKNEEDKTSRLLLTSLSMIALHPAAMEIFDKIYGIEREEEKKAPSHYAAEIARIKPSDLPAQYQSLIGAIIVEAVKEASEEKESPSPKPAQPEIDQTNQRQKQK